MGQDAKNMLLAEATSRYGNIRRVGSGQSLYVIENSQVYIYFRYSKLHSRAQAFYGLREADLSELSGHVAFICFLWNGQQRPMFVPFEDFEDVFDSTTPATDGQYKVQVFLQEEGAELYIARAGRFSIEGYFGWNMLDRVASYDGQQPVIEYTHSQIQTLLGSIGASKNYQVWIPYSDRQGLDWHITSPFDTLAELPDIGSKTLRSVIREIDVIWLKSGTGELRALFEVEHSTPIYSGLLRFNDMLVAAPHARARFSIVSNDSRRALFVRQINRPTFQASGLGKSCSFLEYRDVSEWYRRLSSPE